MGETAEVEASEPTANGGQPPGVPIGPRVTGTEAASGAATAEGPKVCVPCLIARGVVLVLISAALITMLILDRRSKAAAAAPAQPAE